MENTRTFANKEIKTKTGKPFTKMYSCNKFVSHYYIYIHDKELGLCYLKISSYMPFVCEFYMNGHNYLKQQFDICEADYKMKDNSFVQVPDTALLKSLVEKFQPSIALDRISYWMNMFFRFDKGNRSTRSKLLTHQWYTYQLLLNWTDPQKHQYHKARVWTFRNNSKGLPTTVQTTAICCKWNKNHGEKSTSIWQS